MPNALVAAAATGLPVSSSSLATIDDCCVVYAGLQNMLDAVTGVMNRPNCGQDTSAFARLDKIMDWLAAEADRVVVHVEAMDPQTKSEADERALLMIQHEINCGSNTAAVAAVAAKLTLERSRIREARH